VFASIVKNEGILNKNIDILEKMMNPSSSGDQSDMSLPHITSLDDIYDTGVLCSAKAYNDKQNPLVPYQLNLFPLYKAHMIGPAQFDAEIEPLINVLAERDLEKEVSEDQLDEQDQVNFKFLKK